ncbi:hypothetical protein BH24ACT22_BH24ACT22_18680 [soil metagenome]
MFVRYKFLFIASVLMTTLSVAGPASAHEKWFQDASGFPLRWDLFFRPLPLVLVTGVLLATLAALVLWRRWGQGIVPGPEFFGSSDSLRALFYGLVPLILGVHVAVPLLVSGVQGELFSPNNELPGVWANFLGFAETMVALSLFYGAFTRIAAGGLASLWVFGVFLIGPQAMLDNTLYLGFAAFFFLAGRGPYSVDRMLMPRLEPPESSARYAIPALRVGLGFSFMVVAFTEKLANIPLGLAFLENYPLNFAAGLGVPISDEVFVLLAGSVEFLIGLWLILGIFPREIVVLALGPTNLTLTVFSWTELIGHLPIYGILAVLLLWGSGKDAKLWLAGLRGKRAESSGGAGALEDVSVDRLSSPPSTRR